MNLYLFDFDGTITKMDSLFEFTKFSCGRLRYYSGMIVLLPVLVAAKFGIISRDRGKKMFLKYFFANKNKQHLEKQGIDFCKNILPGLLRPNAIKEINRLKHEGHTIAIVSASLDIWLKPFADLYGVNLICTKAAYDTNNFFTGDFNGKNCNKAEKRDRILKTYDLSLFDTVISYGDTKFDKDMFELSHTYYYKHF